MLNWKTLTVTAAAAAEDGNDEGDGDDDAYTMTTWAKITDKSEEDDQWM